MKSHTSVLVHLLVGTILLGSLAGCSDSVKHPLDDSETRPASAAAAVAEANATLDDIGATTMANAPAITNEWTPDSGCGTQPDAPEQGDVGQVLYRAYADLPPGTTVQSLMRDLTSKWEAEGKSVGLGSSNMPQQVINRTNGIGYSLVETPPGVELRAFLPCY